METGEPEPNRPAPLHPYLQALLAAQVPVDQVIVQAEGLGFAPEELLRLAGSLVGVGRGQSPMSALLLVLGAAEHWQPFVAQALGLGLRFLEPLIHPGCSEFDALAHCLEGTDWDVLCRRVLARLGHPVQPWLQATGAAAVLPWLDQDQGLVLDGLELTRFTSRARAWRQVLVDALILRDGAGPRALNHASGDPWSEPMRSTRLHHVRRLRILEGLENLSILVATDCPDLASLDCTPPVLVLKGCPSLREVRSHPRSRLLHLEDCRQLRSIGAAQVWDSSLNESEKVTPSHQSLILRECPALRNLPARLDVTGPMSLRGIGPIHRWPEDFHVGGDLRIRDCPHIEELPPLEVQGCLRVAGESGLRRLAPGTVVGRHLDLRACRHLEEIPRGVRVGGALYLPAHLHRQTPVFEAQEPLLEVPVDHYPVLRSLLLGLSFAGLSRPAERHTVRQDAEAALASLKGELLDNPRMESELLWTASEVWRDLAEELWAEEHPWSCYWNESDDDLPLAWFRGLLLSA